MGLLIEKLIRLKLSDYIFSLVFFDNNLKFLDYVRNGLMIK